MHMGAVIAILHSEERNCDTSATRHSPLARWVLAQARAAFPSVICRWRRNGENAPQPHDDAFSARAYACEHLEVGAICQRQRR